MESSAAEIFRPALLFIKGGGVEKGSTGWGAESLAGGNERWLIVDGSDVWRAGNKWGQKMGCYLEGEKKYWNVRLCEEIFLGYILSDG